MNGVRCCLAGFVVRDNGADSPENGVRAKSGTCGYGILVLPERDYRQALDLTTRHKGEQS